MKVRLYHYFAIVLCCLLVSGAGSYLFAEESCKWQPWKCWTQKTRLLELGSFYEGVPVWSDDDQYIAGVEQRYETRLDLSKWPLQSVWPERNHEYRIVKQGAKDLRPQPVSSFRPGLITELYYMRRLGYFLYKRLGSDPGYYIYHEASGDEWFVSDITPYDHDYQVHVKATPSPDGKLIAVLRCEGSIIVPQQGDSPVFPNLCEVRFLSVPDGLNLVQSVRGIFLPNTPAFEELHARAALSQPERSRWTRQGHFIVTDWQEHAFRISPHHDFPLVIDVPPCLGPATTSGKTSMFGDYATISGNRFAVSDPPPRLKESFDCQRNIQVFFSEGE